MREEALNTSLDTVLAEAQVSCIQRSSFVPLDILNAFDIHGRLRWVRTYLAVLLVFFVIKLQVTLTMCNATKFNMTDQVS